MQCNCVYNLRKLYCCEYRGVVNGINVGHRDAVAGMVPTDSLLINARAILLSTHVSLLALA